MPLILVVEQEQRYVERISEALSRHGWDVEGVHDRASALQFVAGRSANLVVVNIEVPESGELITHFSRRSGGPGTVVLIPESAEDGASELGADEVLQKPFTDQDIRLAVRRCLIGVASVTGSEAKELIVEETPIQESPVEKVPVEASVAEELAEEAGRRLTSEDIFGDVVSELESALAMGTVGSLADASTAVSGPPKTEPSEPPKSIESEVIAATAGLGEAVSQEDVSIEPSEEPLEQLAVEFVEPEEALAETHAEEAAAPVEEAPVGEAPQPEPEPEPEVEQVPRPDPAKILDARIRQAAEEGKRLAASKAPQGAPAVDPLRSADELLRRALMGIEPSAAPASESAPATIEEVDEIVSSAVAPEAASAQEAGEPEASEPEAAEPESGEAEGGELAVGELESGEMESGEPEIGELVAAESQSDELQASEAEIDPPEAAAGLVVDELPESETAAVLEVVEGVEQSGFRARLKLIWAILIIALLALLAFLFARRVGDDLPSTADPVDSSQTVPVIGPGEAVAPSEGLEAGESGEPLTESEEELRRELEAQRLQLQEEISKSQSSSGDGDGS